MTSGRLPGWASLNRWGIAGGADRSLLSNAGSLFGTTVLTGAFGAIYWAIAARLFPPSAIGIAGAAISAMVLLGRVATVGLGTVLMGELSQHEGSERRLIVLAVTVTTVIGVILGAAFIAAAGSIAPELRTLNEPVGVLLFAVGVGTTAAGFVLDQSFIGLLRGGLQLLRNTFASVAKVLILVGLAATGFVLLRPDGPSLLFTWVAGGVLSMALIWALPRPSGGGRAQRLWRIPDGLARLAMQHHLLNLSILAPGLLLPLLVTVVLSADASAYFYIAYTIANLVWAVPVALATALYAAAGRDIAALSTRIRLAFRLSIAVGVVLNLVMLVGAEAVLSIFGPLYSERASGLLRLLSLAIFPLTINSLYVQIARIERRFLQGATFMAVGMIVSFSFVIVGAHAAGLDGIGAGWLLGVSIGVLPLVPAVFRAAVRRSQVPTGT